MAALGRGSQRDLGCRTIPLDSIVGTVDRDRTEFDRSFLPASPGARTAGSASPQRADAGQRCRRSTSTASARSTSSRTATTGSRSRARGGDTMIEARRRGGQDQDRRRSASCGSATCRSSATSASSSSASRWRPTARARIQLSDEWRYAQLATLVEAWGLRASHEPGRLLPREEMAVRLVPRRVRARGAGAARRRDRR